MKLSSLKTIYTVVLVGLTILLIVASVLSYSFNSSQNRNSHALERIASNNQSFLFNLMNETGAAHSHWMAGEGDATMIWDEDILPTLDSLKSRLEGEYLSESLELEKLLSALRLFHLGSFTNDNQAQAQAAFDNVLNFFGEMSRFSQVDINDLSDASDTLLYRSNTIVTILLIITLIWSGLGWFWIRRTANQTMNVLKENLKIFNQGNTPQELLNGNAGDFFDVYAEVSELKDRFKKIKLLAQEVGEGNFESDIEVFDREAELGLALANMRTSLHNVAQEDEKRNWMNTGFAKFGDVLRQQTNDFEELSYQLISELVEYLEAQQGALYIVEEEDEVLLKPAACYAFHRKKFMEETFIPGEGLVGECYLEKETIYLSDVPEDYMSIRSGLGDSMPRNIILVPLKVNDDIQGVLELASFNHFEEHQRKFLIELGESIAATIGTAKVNDNTKRLLEESRQLTEQMQSQEEEMRQNMEELQATQEEMGRKAAESQQLLESLNEKSEMMEVMKDIAVFTSNAKSYQRALKVCLQKVCIMMNWSLGHAYLVKQEEGMVKLSSQDIWHFSNSFQFMEFKKVTSERGFAPGEGLPGRVYVKRTAQWVKSIEKDTNFPRADIALKVGLKSAIAFPIISQDNVTAVLEFFSDREEEPKQELLSVMDNVGKQLGGVLETVLMVNEIKRQQKEIIKESFQIDREKRELEAGRETVEMIFDNLSESVFVLNQDLEIDNINLNAVSLLGADSEKSKGQKLEHFFPVIKDQALNMGDHFQLKKGNTNYEVVVSGFEKNEERKVMLSLRPIY